MLRETQTTQARLDKTIQTIRTKKHLDEGLVELIDQVARLQLETRGRITLDLPDKEVLASASEVLQGRPLLALHDFPVDFLHSEALFAALLVLLDEHPGSLGQAARAVAKAVDSGDIDLEEAFARFLAGNTTYFERWAKEFPEAPRTLDFLVQASLTPSLEAASEKLAEHLPEGTRTTGSCPVCGGLPFIASIRGKKGQRFATCSMCRHEYRVRRLACPYCDEDDASRLKYFTAREEPGYRVDTCESCGLYIKTVDFREMDRHEIPALDDLDSLALDFVADREGYRRATLSAWGF